ncbi:type ISP restriction/modification enzyme [uncultured Flavobacterium sp.]|uniref:type ISP restriction/modification enzyme n=1 Tax=uncultured Flavobacterium sp. TaxID=165435 RepID=UPI00262B16E5|nr:type ISP restriction/modification enzyme [uncultured Flavobacterium sp.]
MTLTQYIDKINTLYKTGNAREHSYRGDLQNLIMAILPDVLVTNEPARVDCGAPDYVLTRKDVPVGYIEAKDIGVDLGSKTLKEQFDRYKSGLSNLIFTDYMDFHFYKDGELTTKIAIATLQQAQDGKSVEIVPIPENFDQFNQLIKNFAETISQTIKSPTKLAQMMAGKAKLMADIIEKSLNYDDQEGKRSQLKSQMLSFQQMLIHDIDNKAFSDIYAQTIAYGMFAARYHDPTLPTFSRMEAAELIPKSNPFLRKLFQDIAGFDLDTRLTWIVDELVNIFLASDVATIMKNFGKSTKQEDPVVHFYETFLGEYNPALRKARGVWYTPQPVVNFIVRAVDDILKTEFNLPQGLADTNKIKIKKKAVTQTGTGANSKIKEVETETEVHKVQILDPATGTGTFLAEVVKHIHKKFEGQQGIWSKYVTNDLIPRLNGFELLMASYAMAHLKMDMLLTETGFKPTDDQRFKIFLTNSLEEAHPDTQTLFSSWLSDEADQANAIKRDAPVMVVIGNPPYSVSSTNKSPWIESLTADYKKDMKERNIQPLSDDYIKFIRFGQHFIDKNGEGILAYISNNSFVDGIIHRQMRKHLLESFDKIYILDLHGNAKKKEVSPDGSIDQNVFDIMAGVSINLFIKTGKKKENEFGEVFNFDLYGKRELKYDFLNNNNLSNIEWNYLKPNIPNLFFVAKNELVRSKYELGFSINEIFRLGATGVITERDALTIHHDEKKLVEIIEQLKILNEEDFRNIYTPKPDGRDWKVSYAKNDVLKNHGVITDILYRPFDVRKTYYTGKSKGFMAYPRNEVMSHMVNNNLGLCFSRLVTGNIDWRDVLVTNKIVEKGVMAMRVSNNAPLFPLYLYTQTNDQQSLLNEVVRTPNLNMEIVNEIAKGLGLSFTPEKEDGNVCLANDKDVRSEFRTTFAPIDLLDYIYAVLHSPTYRETYKEFLKIDFPRVPYPHHVGAGRDVVGTGRDVVGTGRDLSVQEIQENFWKLVALGGELRQIHLLESPIVEKYITQYPEDGDNVVTKPTYKNGSVYINDTQYFANVPEVAWNFYIGGYQPAQKWLKDRKERELGFEDILHYQKIIVALTETDRIMKEIDKIEI